MNLIKNEIGIFYFIGIAYRNLLSQNWLLEKYYLLRIKLYNLLKPEIKQFNNINSFKDVLKHFLFSKN